MANDPNWADIVQSVCAVIGAVGVVVTLALSAWQIHLASQQIRAAAIQAKRESEDRNRPYIAIDVVPSIGGWPGTWDLRMINTGGTAARHITISLKDGQFTSSDSNGYLAKKLKSFSSTPFDLMPRANRRIYWIIGSQQDGDVVEGAPLIGTVLLDYYWERDDNSIHYQDYLPYDCTIPPIPEPATGSRRIGTTHDDQLKNIEYALRGISRQIGEMNR